MQVAPVPCVYPLDLSLEGRNGVVHEFQLSQKRIRIQRNQRMVAVFKQGLHTVALFRERAKTCCNSRDTEITYNVYY